VPLSEDEQKILNEIESQFYESDPRLAREVKSTTVYTRHVKILRWSVLGFLLGILIMIFTLSIHVLLSATGFVIMLVAVLVFDHNFRQLSKTGMQQRAQKKRNSDVWDIFGSTGQKMRDRFQRDS